MIISIKTYMLISWIPLSQYSLEGGRKNKCEQTSPFDHLCYEVSFNSKMIYTWCCSGNLASLSWRPVLMPRMPYIRPLVRVM